MVTMMKPLKFRFNGRWWAFNYAELAFVVGMGIAIGIANNMNRTSHDAIQANSEAMNTISTLSRQRAAAEMRALDAERKNSQPTSGVNVIVISPDGKTSQQQIPARSYADVTRQL